MTALSSALERNVRLEMGRKLLGSSGSRPGFFRRGVMAASLSGVGTVPEVREELMMLVMSGTRGVEQAMTRFDGMGSRGEVDGFMVVSILVRSAVVMGEKCVRGWIEGGASGGSGTGVVAEEDAS